MELSHAGAHARTHLPPPPNTHTHARARICEVHFIKRYNEPLKILLSISYFSLHQQCSQWPPPPPFPASDTSSSHFFASLKRGFLFLPSVCTYEEHWSADKWISNCHYIPPSCITSVATIRPPAPPPPPQSPPPTHIYTHTHTPLFFFVPVELHYIHKAHVTPPTTTPTTTPSFGQHFSEPRKILNYMNTCWAIHLEMSPKR